MLPQTFHPIIRAWFAETYGKPTSVQAESWPLIEQGENILALAPTGSGKTLTAFLSAISRFCSQTDNSSAAYPAEKLSVLYISPLKALNEDIKRNLLEPLAAIKLRFEKEGVPFPPVRVETRSGDTPQSQRRRFFIHPPSILALTPESLAILLLNPKGRQVLSNVKYLIIDEVHALIGNKRGAYLSCQIDRLSFLAGEFQRISLSATVRNPQITAEFIGGIGRKVKIVAPPAEKKIEFTVEFPDTEIDAAQNASPAPNSRFTDFGSRYTPLINYILSRIWEGSTLLVFVESRRRAERLCYFLNQEASAFFSRNGNPKRRNSGEEHDLKESQTGSTIAFPHHGSLSKEIRRSVEKGLSEGRLPCVVATASLELGIDIGSIDEVVLAGSPFSVSQSLQRIGRSGHRVGQTSRGKLFAFHGMDLLAAAAVKSAVDDRDIEEVKPIENPQDILAQLILALCCEKTRNIDELYEHLKKYYLFRNLNYDSYYRVIRMLSGFASKENEKETRLRDIKPRIWIDKIEGTIGKLDSTTTLLYSSGGVIANRGLYSLRLADGTKIGELDEEFVWERAIGDCFDFGARGWRITNISAESVEVNPLEKRADFIPFWKSETVFRSLNLTKRILALLEEYNNIKVKPNTTDSTSNSSSAACYQLPANFNQLSNEAEKSLKVFLDSQQRAQKEIPLPDTKNIIVEIIKGTELNRDFCSVILHTFRGGQVNYPLSLAMSAELEQTVKLRVASFSSDDSILFLIPRLGLEENKSSNVQEIFRQALINLEKSDTGNITRGERFFRNRLESSGLFGAAFREAAERCLLLPKSPFGKRTPLWIMRQRAKRLFDAVAGEDGFPVTAESWRTCLVDTFDMDGFRNLITDINNGSVTLFFFTTNIPSPFSRDIVRQETNAFMYEYDERSDLYGHGSATLSDKVIEEAIGNADLRPVLKQEVIESFTSRLRREIEDYAPEDDLSLNEWVKERIAIPEDEWKTLCAVMPKALSENIDTIKIKTVMRNGALVSSIIHREYEKTWNEEPLSLLGQWLRYEGPISIDRICAVFGASKSETEDAINALVEVDEVIRDIAVSVDTEILKNQRITRIYAEKEIETINSRSFASLDDQYTSLICDRENLDMLLRLSRKKERPVIKERPSSLLVPFLALRQGLTGENTNASFRKNLQSWSAPAKLWETEILCARNFSYEAEILNREIREGNLIWYGTGKERIGFCSPEDLDLASESKNINFGSVNKDSLFTQVSKFFFDRPRDFWEIKNEINSDSRKCAQALWREVWRGSLTSDSFDPVRRGIECGFIPKEIELPQQNETSRAFGRHPRIPGALKNRWKGGAPVHGNWFSLLLDEEQEAIDPLEEDAINRDRVRLLLSRWGILCRPLLEHEDTVFSWSRLLPAMRRMELAGELVTGRFFSGINSLQFASPSIAAELEKAESINVIYWMNAADPASLAGVDISITDYKLCARSSNNRLYFKGADLIAISLKNGKELQIFIKADDACMTQLLELLKLPRTRNVLPENKIIVEKINAETAARSEYAEHFKSNGFVCDRGKLICW